MSWVDSSLALLSTLSIFCHHHHRFTAIFPGPPRWAGARRELLDFMVQGKINRGRHTDNAAGRHYIRTNHYYQYSVFAINYCMSIINHYLGQFNMVHRNVLTVSQRTVVYISEGVACASMHTSTNTSFPRWAAIASWLLNCEGANWCKTKGTRNVGQCPTWWSPCRI